jgi:hypothetical protein
MTAFNFRPPAHPVTVPLAGGGGPPHDDGMEARMSSVEAAIGRIDASLARIETTTRKIELDVAELKGRISQLPTAIQMIGMVLGVLALAGLSAYFNVRPAPLGR